MFQKQCKDSDFFCNFAISFGCKAINQTNIMHLNAMPVVRAAVAAAVCAICVCLSASAGETLDKVKDYLPSVHGVLRTRMEIDTRHGDMRFQVRNARVMLDGHVGPAVSYYLNTDFCDRGVIKILDAWAAVRLGGGVSVRAGQFRVPFGVETFRGPANYIFANRSFMGKQMCNVRAVGARLTYVMPFAPLTVEGGVFNPATIGDHTGWHRSMAYAAKAVLSLGGVSVAGSFASLVPKGSRASLADLSVGWRGGRWTAEAEYMFKRYCGGQAPGVHGYCVFADYAMPVRAAWLNRLSFQARMDGMTDHSDGSRDESGALVVGDCGRNRLTLGSTVSYLRSAKVHVDLRLNYEKYFYQHGHTPGVGDADRATLELVVSF